MSNRVGRSGIPIVLLGLAVIVFVTGCSSTPATTRTGGIHDIKIEESVHPEELIVAIGDEVRWVNHRNLPVRVDLVGDPVSADAVACQRGFTNMMGMKQNQAAIDPNESASLCFKSSNIYTYNVRMDSALPGGKAITTGRIRVGNIPR